MEKKEAIEIVRKLYNNSLFLKKDKEAMVTLIPELKESEDERIRKSLIDMLKNDEKCYLKEIAWLEKQGKHADFLNKIQIGDRVTRNEDVVLVNLSQLKRVAKPSEQNQGEQKSVPDWMPKFLDELRSKKNYFDWDEHKDIEGGILAIIKWMNPNYFNEKYSEQKPADKVEPKFKVGDWVVYCNEDVDLITGIEENGYCINNGGYIPFVCASDVRLWTIQDAKAGDVLSWDDSKCIALFKNIYDKESFNGYGLVGHCTGTFESRQSYHDIEGAHPASKEQRDLLFQKMHEAGYEWDAEKKELRKGEQKPVESDDTNAKRMFIKALECVEEQNAKGYKLTDCDKNSWWEDFKTYTSCTVEQNPAEWSEEDEKTIHLACEFIRHHSNHNDSIGGIDCPILIERLKSLRPQKRWMPSDEQLTSLAWVIEYGNTSQTETLKELLEQLKAL